VTFMSAKTDFYLTCDGLLGRVDPDGDTATCDVEVVTAQTSSCAQPFGPLPPAGRTVLNGRSSEPHARMCSQRFRGLRDTHRVMSEESATRDLVEAVTGLFEAADRGDWDAVLRPYAPDVVWDTQDVMTEAVGAARLRGFFEEWFGMFEAFAIEAETVVDLGNGVVYSIYRQSGRPSGSTGVVTLRAALIYVWVDGMIARLIARPDVDEARALAERLAESKG
jgi:ketosteroid isomerase-like protein